MRELTLPSTLLMLPGMAAQAHLFKPQIDAFGSRFVVPSWIDAHRGESLGHYARRWAETINGRVAGFDPERPWFFGGMSMGGMLALEMLPHLDRPPAAVFLIASSRSTPTIAWPLRLAAGLAQRLSDAALKRCVKLGAVPFGFFDGQDDVGYRLLKTFGEQADPALLRWALGATVDWQYPGPPPGDATPPIFQAHGRRDWLLPLQRQDVDLVIERGRHLITLSHPVTLNRWLFDHIIDLTPGASAPDEPRVEDPDRTLQRRPEVAARY